MGDLVLYNGTFYTLDPAQPVVSALAIRDGVIVYAGEDATALAYAQEGWQKEDVRGACGVPGLIDSHVHYYSYAMALQRVYVETPTKQECLDAVAARAAVTPPGEWIGGFGFNHNVWGDGAYPTSADLDAVTTVHPVALQGKSGHAFWCNSLALAKAGITADTPDPEGGEIVRHADGTPTGMLLETALFMAMNAIPVPPSEKLEEALIAAQDAYASKGLAGIHDVDDEPAWPEQHRMQRNGRLTIRTFKAIAQAKLDEAIGVGIMSGFGNDWLRVSGCKIFTDGALGPRTAWMLDGYETDPSFCGITHQPIEKIRQDVLRANAHGLSTIIHAIGDRANRAILDIYAEARDKGLSQNLRNRIEHAQIVHPDDIARFGALGVIVSAQPIHATSDMLIADKHLGARSPRAYAFKDLADGGAVLAFGSDSPVEVCDPLLAIHAAVTRRRADGSPGSEGWHPSQCLTVEQAVRAYALGSAYAVGQEHKLGSLTPGKLGDVSLFSEDLFAIDPHAIKDVSVMGTVVGGSFAYRSESL